MAQLTMQHKTLTEETQHHLMELVVEGILRPGQPLRVETLCEQYGFTHTPLREALRVLAAQGIVEYASNRGYCVPQTGIEELMHIFQVREYLEGLAARLLAGHATEQQLAELQGLAVEADRHIQDPPATVSQSIGPDLEFHRVLVLRCGNELICRALLPSNILLRTLAKAGFDVRTAGYKVNHQAVVHAIASGDPDQAERVLRSHIREGADRVIAPLSISASIDTAE